MHVKASLMYNHMLRKNGLDKKYPPIYSGDKIKFIELKMPNPAKAPVIACNLSKIPAELGLDDYFDKETQFEKTVVSPIRDLVSHIGWTTEAVSSLEDFWS